MRKYKFGSGLDKLIDYIKKQEEGKGVYKLFFSIMYLRVVNGKEKCTREDILEFTGEKKDWLDKQVQVAKKIELDDKLVFYSDSNNQNICKFAKYWISDLFYDDKSKYSEVYEEDFYNISQCKLDYGICLMCLYDYFYKNNKTIICNNNNVLQQIYSTKKNKIERIVKYLDQKSYIFATKRPSLTSKGHDFFVLLREEVRFFVGTVYKIVQNQYIVVDSDHGVSIKCPCINSFSKGDTFSFAIHRTDTKMMTIDYIATHYSAEHEIKSSLAEQYLNYIYENHESNDEEIVIWLDEPEKIYVDKKEVEDCFKEKNMSELKRIYEIDKKLNVIMSEFHKQNTGSILASETGPNLSNLMKEIPENYKTWITEKTYIVLKDKKVIYSYVGNQIAKYIYSGVLEVIIGMAGTGKTYSLKKRMEELLKIDGYNQYRSIAISNKAVINLINSGLEKSQTVCSFLKNGNIKDLDLLIIDETSMVSIENLYDIFQMIEKCNIKKIILVGDSHQIPALEEGNILENLEIVFEELTKHESKLIDWFHEKKKVYRTDSHNQVYINSRKIVNNNTDLEIRSTEFEIYNGKELENQLEQLKNNEDFVLLSYSNEMVKELNERMKKKKGISDNRIDERVYIINTNYLSKYGTENRYVRGLQGTIDSKAAIPKYYYVNVNGKSGKTKFLIPEDDFETGYAMTVHKAQGSGYNTVLIYIPDGKEYQWDNSLLYTAITRAKKKVILIMDENKIAYIIETHRKYSKYLSQLIIEKLHEYNKD